MARLLIVEDEAHLATGIRFNLELEGYDVALVADGAKALELLAGGPRGAFDLVLLDVMLPGMDGFELTRRLRQAGDHTPILMLTAKGLPEDMVEGLEAGADDYLPKPFDLTVLLARVKGLLRRRDWARSSSDGPVRVRIGDVEVDFGSFEAHGPRGTSRLTLLEAMLLKLLVQNADRVVSKAEILEKVWNVSPDTQTRAVDNFILRLRRYIETDAGNPRHLQTVRGAGYRLVLEP
ncbi:MAG: response regulator transcription factor [Vicinamibacteria bacterium]